MAAGDPIILGTASGTSTLTPDAGSKISTNEFGIQRGAIRFQLGNQSRAQTLRPEVGARYAGNLPQFKDFLVDDPGDLLGAEGQAAFLDVIYAAQDPRFVILPKFSQDIEFRDVPYSTDNTASNIPVPHPLLTYKFSAAKNPNQRGTWAKRASLPSAPAVERYIYFPSIAAVIGFVFIPFPADTWLCIKEDVEMICGGKLFQIEQQWKATYYFNGLGSR